MLVTLLVIASVVFVTALAIIGYMYIEDRACNQRVVQRHLVRQEQRLAEARVQRAMQETVEQMFRAVRDHQ